MFNLGNTKIKANKKGTNNYKDIDTYKPLGKIIYNNDLMKKLTIND